MNILYVEPFYSGSHKQWIDAYREYSSHDIDILSLPGSRWKWRMHGGAITLADEYNKTTKTYSLILCSDFLNLPVFISQCKGRLVDTPISMYFHENQASYPWSPRDRDVTLERDFHYYFINQTSSLASDWNLFNSEYHLESYLDGLKRYLNKMPDNKNIKSIEEIENKSSILYIGCDLLRLSKPSPKKENKKPVVLWNHRWEFDKNPDLFFKTLIKLKNNGFEFSLIILGENYSNSSDIFNHAKEALSDEIIHIGYCESFREYRDWLWKADILPVTSIQDFFGISIIEATYCDTYPILPDRLSYTELFKKDKNPDLFYRTDTQLYNKLRDAMKNHTTLSSYSHIAKEYDWSKMVLEYDDNLRELAKKLSF